MLLALPCMLLCVLLLLLLPIPTVPIIHALVQVLHLVHYYFHSNHSRSFIVLLFDEGCCCSSSLTIAPAIEVCSLFLLDEFFVFFGPHSNTCPPQGNVNVTLGARCCLLTFVVSCCILMDKGTRDIKRRQLRRRLTIVVQIVLLERCVHNQPCSRNIVVGYPPPRPLTQRRTHWAHCPHLTRALRIPNVSYS
jgi:hypothetical protein